MEIVCKTTDREAAPRQSKSDEIKLAFHERRQRGQTFKLYGSMRARMLSIVVVPAAAAATADAASITRKKDGLSSVLQLLQSVLCVRACSRTHDTLGGSCQFDTDAPKRMVSVLRKGNLFQLESIRCHFTTHSLFVMSNKHNHFASILTRSLLGYSD